MCTPELGIELLGQFDEVTGRVGLVCTLDLSWCQCGNNGGCQMICTAAVTRARTPDGRFPGPGSSVGVVSMIPDEQ